MESDSVPSSGLEKAGRPTSEASDREEAKVEMWMEIVPSILMALAVVLTAYSAYESTRWGGVQATNFATASALRAEANSVSATCA